MITPTLARFILQEEIEEYEAQLAKKDSALAKQEKAIAKKDASLEKKGQRDCPPSREACRKESKTAKMMHTPARSC